MPSTARVRSALARYLLANPSPGLRRRVGVLRVNPFPPGSRSLATDESWHELAKRIPDLTAYVYGTSDDALVYTYDRVRDVLSVELVIVEGRLVPE